jgi:2'-5' RNA ligase
MARIRTFVAIELGSDVRARAAALIERLRAAQADVKWVDPANLHWTLQFLGDVDTREIADVCQAVVTAVADLPVFEVEARGAGAFPDVNRPRTIWMGVSRGAEELTTLHGAIERGLFPLGFRAEKRRFVPHLTLGRVRGGPDASADLAELLEQHGDYPGGMMDVAEVTVFSSDLSRAGPKYDVLATAPLAE